MDVGGGGEWQNVIQGKVLVPGGGLVPSGSNIESLGLG